MKTEIIYFSLWGFFGRELENQSFTGLFSEPGKVIMEGMEGVAKRKKGKERRYISDFFFNHMIYAWFLGLPGDSVGKEST